VRIATLNPEFMLEAQRNDRFRTALNKMTHCVIDGSGLLGMLTLLRKRLSIASKLEMYHGSDLVEDLFQEFKEGQRSFYLLGGPEGMASDAAASLRARFPNFSIVGAESGGVISLEKPVERELLERVNSAHPDILLIGFGAPKQELWMAAAGDQLKVPVAIGVGGSFGFYTVKRRAPRLVRKLHFEWLWRAATEPGHAKRAFRAVVLFPIFALLSARKETAR
jgi:N-acetylglucosaminyldiphosphoundecaprenol N-acetyl-beta-D-mannosaminyltransferase